MVTLKNIEKARIRVSPDIRKTPVLSASSAVAGTSLFLKAENMQLTGAFKERGAVNKLKILKQNPNCKGIIAASAGNHAQAVSLHATRLGFEATIVMPEFTATNKVLATQKWGGKVKLVGKSFDEATEHAKSIVKPNEAFIHAFDDEEVVAGQGTLGLELLDDMPDLDTVVVAIGGGGLGSGLCIALKEINPKIRIIGVQAERYAHSYLAIKKLPPVQNPEALPTLGDGISMKRVGQVTLPILQKYLDDIVTVSEEEMANAVLYLLETSKLLAEGAGAASMAAILSEKFKQRPGNCMAIISGGNIDVNLISRIIEKGLIKTHRLARLNVIVPDRPGGLKGLTALLADGKANILQIHHERASSQIAIDTTGTELTLEIKGEDHLQEIIKTLKDNHYAVTLID